MNDTNRVVFLDNLRTLMVLLVLIFHSGSSYAIVPFWPFQNANPSKAIYIFMGIIDFFSMAILFFIAGYFALPSIQKSTVLDFIKSKLKRLGLPWLIITTLLLPVLDYIHYRHTSLQEGIAFHGYAEHWLLSMKRIAGFMTGHLNMTKYLDMTVQFYQRYMWFISLLLIFFFIFAIIYIVNKNIFGVSGKKNTDKQPSKKHIFPAFLFSGMLIGIFFIIGRFLIFSTFPEMLMEWFSIGSIIQFQCGKLIIYISFFSLGIFAFSRQWFTDNSIGRTWKWLTVWIIIFSLIGLVRPDKPGRDSAVLLVIFLILYPFLILSFLGLFLSSASSYWNRGKTFNRILAENSYDLYLVHYIFPMTIPLLLNAWNVPVFVKFGITALFTLVMSYILSRYIIKPYPRSTIAALIIISIILSILTKY